MIIYKITGFFENGQPYENMVPENIYPTFQENLYATTSDGSLLDVNTLQTEELTIEETGV